MTLAWNCRGLGRPRTVQDLTRLVQVHCPKIVFLSETCQNKNKIEDLRWHLGLKNVLTASNEIRGKKSKGGGLALFWDENLDVQLLGLSNRIIDVLICDQTKGIKWRCTFIYEEPRVHLRHHIWDLLRRIKTVSNFP